MAKKEKLVTAKKPSLTTRVLKISDSEAKKRSDAENKVAADNKFKDSDAVVMTGTESTKYKLDPKKEFTDIGANAKILIAKGAAKFVKVLKEK